MKIKIDKLREMVREAIVEAAAEGKFQKYARGTFSSMIKKISSGGNNNTPPYTEKSRKAGKSAPPGTE
jgi:hypothetical protein